MQKVIITMIQFYMGVSMCTQMERVYELIGQKGAVELLFLELFVSYKNLPVWEISWCSRSCHLCLFTRLLLVYTIVRLVEMEELQVVSKQQNHTKTYR